ncbi:MAG: hypothetical protein M3Q61_05090 [Chloroflexota bacterium]|nr:hypothetical protein [Chloroflexota bacterium]
MTRQDAARIALALALGWVGVAHFVSPRPFVDHLPPETPARLGIVHATGAMEIVLAALLLVARRGARPVVGRITAAYLVAVFPGNLYVATAGVPIYPEPWLAWARLAFQPFFIAWAILSTRR